jgi:hypothetical protein
MSSAFLQLGDDPMTPQEEKQLIQELSEMGAEITAIGRQVEQMVVRIKGTASEPSTLSWARLENPVQLLLALLLSNLGVWSLLSRSTVMAAISAIGIDCFVLYLLLEISLRKRSSDKFWTEVAHRFYFVFIVGFFLIGLVSSFGTLYRQFGQVKGLTNSVQAAYFSSVTLMTLGYGDLYPTNDCGRWLVMGELGSGALLLLFIVPVLSSRLALLGEGH